jgi:D-glycero-alpha-D-manno-heptose 1-phosphate guanylyltransferase
MEAMILAGGLGTRLASVVADRAKPVAEVGGRPFLSFVLAQLARARSVDAAILCVGHKAESVRAALGERHGRLALRYSVEREPLGTGGALRLAAREALRGRTALALNGDSYLGVNVDRVVQEHRRQRAWVTLALARVPDAARYGAADLDGDRVVSFREKGVAGPAWVNAGIYVLAAEAIDFIRKAPRAFSFEREALAPWCAQGRVRGVKSRARFIDIGTPGDYARSATLLVRG